MAPAPHSLTKIAAPAGAFAALAVAVGVWLIPSSALDPRPPAAPMAKPMPGAKPGPVEPPPVVERDWAGLAQALDRLREPIDPTKVADEDEPGEPPGEPPLSPPLAINWQYEGYVAEGDRLIALVRIESVQRFVFPDQEVQDPSIPGYARATIKSIEPDRLVVMVGDHEIVIPRTSQSETNTLLRAQPPTAGRID